MTRSEWDALYHERTAIMQHGAGMTDGEARERAWADMIAVFGVRPKG